MADRCCLQVLTQDGFDLFAWGAVDHHGHALVQERLGAQFIEDVLHRQYALTPRQLGNLQHLQGRLRRFAGAVEHGLGQDPGGIDHLGQREADGHDRECASQHDQHRGYVQERLWRPSEHDRRGDEAEPADQANHRRRVQRHARPPDFDLYRRAIRHRV